MTGDFHGPLLHLVVDADAVVVDEPVLVWHICCSLGVGCCYRESSTMAMNSRTWGNHHVCRGHRGCVRVALQRQELRVGRERRRAFRQRVVAGHGVFVLGAGVDERWQGHVAYVLVRRAPAQVGYLLRGIGVLVVRQQPGLVLLRQGALVHLHRRDVDVHAEAHELGAGLPTHTVDLRHLR